MRWENKGLLRVGLLALSVAAFAKVPDDENIESIAPKVSPEVQEQVRILKESVAKMPYGSDRHRNFLVNRFGFEPGEIHFEQSNPLILRQGLPDEKQVQNLGNPVIVREHYDVIIIGSGPAGLTAGVYLTQAGKKILVLEKNKDIGGLAAIGDRKGVLFARGGAYFAVPDAELLEIYKTLGIGDYDKRFPIPEDIDAYLHNGRLVRNPWHQKHMPADWAAVKYALQRLDKDKRIPDQPFETFPWLEETDTLTMIQWLKRIPKMLELWADGDERAANILKALHEDKDIDPNDPMKDPTTLLDLYGRSALGDHTNVVDAAAFLNFYVNELETRFTGCRGAGEVSAPAYRKLQARPDLAKFRTGAKVTNVEVDYTGAKDDYERLHGTGVNVTYVSNGIEYKVHAKDTVFSAPLGQADKMIANYEQLAPEQYKLSTEIEYRDYIVINVHVAGHPWTGAYDLWVRQDNEYSQDWITDVIDGRWMDFKGRELPRNDTRGVLTIYMPLSKERSQGPKSREEALRLANIGIEQMKKFMNPLVKAQGGGEITVLAAEVNYWENAIHVPKPGHFQNANVLKRPVGNIHFANNNLGTPSIEEALYRGKHAALEIIEEGKCDAPLMKRAM